MMPDSAEIIAELRLQATPLNFEQLIKDGILARHSGQWYEVLVPMEEVPQIVTKQAKAMKFQGNRTLIRLPRSWEQAQKQYRKITGKSYDED